MHVKACNRADRGVTLHENQKITTNVTTVSLFRRAQYLTEEPRWSATLCRPVTSRNKPTRREECKCSSSSSCNCRYFQTLHHITLTQSPHSCTVRKTGCACLAYETRSHSCAAPTKIVLSRLASCTMCTDEQTVSNKLKNL